MEDAAFTDRRRENVEMGLTELLHFIRVWYMTSCRDTDPKTHSSENSVPNVVLGHLSDEKENEASYCIYEHKVHSVVNEQKKAT